MGGIGEAVAIGDFFERTGEAEDVAGDALEQELIEAGFRGHAKMPAEEPVDMDATQLQLFLHKGVGYWTARSLGAEETEGEFEAGVISFGTGDRAEGLLHLRKPGAYPGVKDAFTIGPE